MRLAGTVDSEVVGRRHYPCAVRAGEVLRLLREPGNPHDANAVRVENGRGEQVGYLPRNCAAWLAQWMDSGAIETAGLVPRHAPEDERWGLPLVLAVWTDANVLLKGFPFRWRLKSGEPPAGREALYGKPVMRVKVDCRPLLRLVEKAHAAGLIPPGSKIEFRSPEDLTEEERREMIYLDDD